MEENKSKTIIIQMLIENQNNSNKVDLESNSTQKLETVTRKSNRKLSIHKADKIQCLSRYETLYTDDNVDVSCNSYDSSTSSDSTTSSDIYKRKKSKNFNEKEGDKRKRQEYCH